MRISWFLITQFHLWHAANKRLKSDCQRVAFPVPLSRGGCSCLVVMRCQPLRRALVCNRRLRNKA
ncbi:hypothetical protein FLL68_13300 [Vibrio cholerae]|nr:hypothetical protein FLL73_00050 [Vibrio cholerae]TQQ13837.1 hypothetical protein FLL68_13300 [Vibrio cholerae]